MSLDRVIRRTNRTGGSGRGTQEEARVMAERDQKEAPTDMSQQEEAADREKSPKKLKLMIITMTPKEARKEAQQNRVDEKKKM